MKLNLILILAFFVSSCTGNIPKTGQRFQENSPSFYLSIAPSFSSPQEYEVISNVLVHRVCNGLGGYNWGKCNEQSRKTLVVTQEETIRNLAVAAVKASIQEEQIGNEVLVMDGTGWYIMSDYGLGSFYSVSTNNPPDSFHELLKYLESLLQQEQ